MTLTQGIEMFSGLKRYVIKIGSALLINHDTGKVNHEWLKTLVEDCIELKNQGKDVIIVTSGSVALGRKRLQLKSGKLSLPEKQAAAACGQINLIAAYQELFTPFGVTVAQVLLSIEDSENRKRYVNARNTLEMLLKLGAIPIINENDTVATAELRFGDNDRLAARVAGMVEADILVLFSDIDGLYSANPHLDPKAEFISHVTEITPAIEAMAGGARSTVGSGGMVTKIAAAKIATLHNCHMVICAGKPMHPLKTLLEGGKHTWFTAQKTQNSARKNWLATSLHPVGQVYINACAVEALYKGGSLLPVGTLKVHGNFLAGDTVSICEEHGQEIGRGVIEYNASDAAKLCLQHSSAIAQILGYKHSEELIHRDNLVLNNESSSAL